MTFKGIRIHMELSPPHPEREDLFEHDPEDQLNFPCGICAGRHYDESHCRNCRYFAK